MRLRLLPRDGYSWTGYVWLVYLGTPIWYAWVGRTTGAWAGALTAVAILVFLPLYFIGYRLEGRVALAQLSAVAALGAIVCPWNAGTSVFFVYASSFAGRVGPPLAGAGVLAALIAAIGVESWALHLSPEIWGAAIPLVLLVGGLNVTFLEIGRRQTTLRRAAEEDVRRLAVIAERERIGRDLHDLLGHTLSVITIKAELASKLIERDAGQAAGEIRDIERISRDALAEVRRAVQGYGRVTLSAEVEQARLALESAGAVLECQMADVHLSPPVEQVLALSVREAVTNVIRHARARRCEIRLAPAGSAVRLDIRDDGCGGSAPEGSGLLGMRARVAAVGGRVERDGRAGTRLTITLPAAAAQFAGSEP